MRRVSVVLGALLTLVGVAYTLLGVVVGLSVGFGMSGGTRQQFIAGLVTGALVVTVGLSLVVFGGRQKGRAEVGDSQQSDPAPPRLPSGR